MSCREALDYTLYLVAGTQDLFGAVPAGARAVRALEDAVRAACAGGVTLVQLREKELSHDAVVRLARRIKAVCDEFGVPLVINDDAHAAKCVDAFGVHVGQHDISPARARQIVGPGKIVGVSAHNVSEALCAERAGADYLGVGALCATKTKRDAHLISPQEVERIVAAVRIPCVGIGGVNERTLSRFAHVGLAGFAAVSAIIAQDDTCAAAQRLRSLIETQKVR